MIIIKLKQSILISILILFLSSSSYQVDAQPPSVTNLQLAEINLLLPAPINVDGILSPNEWDGAENVTKWFMDADPANYDGDNYMYIAEDADNLYVALDLVSDQTNDEDGEWVGIWLNTNETVSLDPNPNVAEQDWYNFLNNGMESLLIDVQNNQTMPFFGTSGSEIHYNQINSLGHIIPVDGTFEGSLDDIKFRSDSNYANITSVFNGTKHVTRLDIELPLYEYFEVFPDLLAENTLSARLDGRLFNNDTIDEHYLIIRDSSGTILLDSTDHTKSISTGISSADYITTALSGNFTLDDKVLFSFVGVNDLPFKTSFDQIIFWPFTLPITNLAAGSIDYPYSSIQNYEVAWSFGESEHNATAHRVFEIKIPKSELEGYTEDSDLGIMVGGYGTLAAFPNSHNWVFANKTSTGVPFEYSDEYHYYSMPMKGWIQPNAPVLSPFDPNPSTTGNITLDWNDDPNIVNWTVLRHDSEITELNIDDVQILGTGLTVSQFNDTLITNGLHWYAVAGIDTLGYAYLSNVESVTLNIPTKTSTSSSTSTSITTTSATTSTTDTSESPASSDESDDGFLLGFALPGSFFGVFVAMLYKRSYNKKELM